MSGSAIEARARAFQQQMQLVQHLRDSGHGSEADHLQQTYHAREMSGLADDVYHAARHEGAPPVGWTRASTDPSALRAAGIDLADAQLREFLQPRQSGFRAEIYLPDTHVFGDGAKPVIVYKGSTGEIVDPSSRSGRRESGPEDFVNNGRQGLGMRSDYYDRAMRLASEVNKMLPGGFEIAGHSLGGGLGSAASAVTGARATTFNAAGLHPETPARFARENGLPTYDPQHTVHTYQTVGEVLSDVQTGMQRLSEQHRRGYGALVNEVGMLLQAPAIREAMGDTLRGMMPADAQASATEFIQQLASTSGQDALRRLPVAAGRTALVLEARSRDANDALVDRPQVAAPSQVAELAGPLSTVLFATGQGIRAGRLLGEQLERAGAANAHLLDNAGDAYGRVLRTEGLLIGQGVSLFSLSLQASHRAGAGVMASGHALAGSIEASLHRVQSRAHAGGLSALSWAADKVGLDALAAGAARQAATARDQGEHRAQRASHQADGRATATRAAGERHVADIADEGRGIATSLTQHYASAGTGADQGFAHAAAHARRISGHAPAAMGTLGGVGTGLGAAAATHLPTGLTAADVAKLRNLEDSARVIDALAPSFGEATHRHGMALTVIPSLESQLLELEADARLRVELHERLRAADESLQDLQALQGSRRHTAPAAAVVAINDPGHPDYRLFRSAQAGVHALDAAHNRIPDQRSDQLAAALAVQAKREGLADIHHVVLSEDGSRAFAVDTADLHAAHRRHAHVEVVAGLNQSLATSTAQAEAVDASREQAHVAQLAQQQTQQAPPQAMHR